MRALLLIAALALPLAACAVDSPFSLQGKPKLAAPRCPDPRGCPTVDP